MSNDDGRDRPQVLNLAKVMSHRADLIAVFPGMDDLIRAGTSGLDQVRSAADRALRGGEGEWFADESAVDWSTPLPVRNCIAAGRNFEKHRAEGRERWTAQGAADGFHDLISQGFAKLASVMVPTRCGVARPVDVHSFDYEIEVAAVIGRSASCVPESEALLQSVLATRFSTTSPLANGNCWK
jgi:2-keto-4-pentenoate hydratase/2-oxohepta-3-ene-1,7-dioic acid hydratase in catechol pathway